MHQPIALEPGQHRSEDGSIEAKLAPRRLRREPVAAACGEQPEQSAAPRAG